MPEHAHKLGDLLAEAECKDEHVTEHCHHEDKHALGCWVLRAILGQ